MAKRGGDTPPPSEGRSGADGFGDLGGLGGGEEFFDEGEAEIEGGACAAGGDEVAVDDDALRGENVFEFVGGAGVCGVALVFEQAGVVEDGGRGADGGEPFAAGCLGADDGGNAEIGAKFSHAGAARENEQIEGAACGNGGKQTVGLDGDVVFAFDGGLFAQGGDGDLGSGAAEDVDRGDGFNFFKSLWQNDEDRRHGFRNTMISTNAPGNLSGKRLVIFGAGYVGGVLARQAVAAGAQVTALTRNEEKARAFSAEGIEAVVADLAGDAWHRQIAGGADFVVNCVSGGGAGIEGYRRSYLEGMRSVAGWLTANGGAGAVVYTSSTSVYPQDGGVRVDETAAVDREGERPRVLVEAEEVLMGLPKSAGRRTVLRLAGIYGPQRHHLLEQVRSGEVAGRGDHHLNLIHREDICAAIWSALLTEAADGQIFNVADDGAAPKAEIVGWLAEKLGVAVPRFSGVPEAGRRAVTPDRVIDNAKIKRVLGWRARYPSFREGYAAILGA